MAEFFASRSGVTAVSVSWRWWICWQSTAQNDLPSYNTVQKKKGLPVAGKIKDLILAYQFLEGIRKVRARHFILKSEWRSLQTRENKLCT